MKIYKTGFLLLPLLLAAAGLSAQNMLSTVTTILPQPDASFQTVEIRANDKADANLNNIVFLASENTPTIALSSGSSVTVNNLRINGSTFNASNATLKITNSAALGEVAVSSNGAIFLEADSTIPPGTGDSPVTTLYFNGVQMQAPPAKATSLTFDNSYDMKVGGKSTDFAPLVANCPTANCK